MNYQIKYFIMIRVAYKYGDDSERKNYYYMEPESVKDFLISMIRLHHSPGVNPYNKNKCQRITYLAIERLEKPQSYWWTTPSLGLNESERVPVASLWNSETVYLSPKLHAEQIKDERQEAYPYICEGLELGETIVTKEFKTGCGPFIHADFEEYFDMDKETTYEFVVEEYTVKSVDME